MVAKDTQPSVVAKVAVPQVLRSTDKRFSNPQSRSLIVSVLQPLPPMEDHIYPNNPSFKPSPLSSTFKPVLVDTQPNKAPAMTTAVSSSPSPSPSGPKEEKKEPKKPYMGGLKAWDGFSISCTGVICCCFMPDDENHCCNRPSTSPSCNEC